MDSAQIFPGTIQKRDYHFTEADENMEYALYVPSGYSSDKKSPLVVLLHGLFSNPHQVIRYSGLIDEAEKRGYIIVAPMGYNDRGWYGSVGTIKSAEVENLGDLSEQDVLNVLNIVRQDFNVDETRIYCMGHSMGGAGTLHLGAKYSDVWAALAPMSPALPFPSYSDLLKLMPQVPVMVVTGDQDTITPVAPTRKLVDTMENMGMDCKYNELQGAGHLAPAFRPDIMVEIFDFFAGRARKVSAPSVTQRRTAGTAASAPAVPVEKHESWFWYGTRIASRFELVAWSAFYFAKSLPNTFFSFLGFGR